MTRTLILDLETRPHLGWVWDLWNQNISLSQLVETGQVISFAAKWHGDRKVMFYSDFHDGHEVMVRKAHELWTEADILVHYYGDRFDLPHLRREFVLAGLNPPAPAQSVDLKTVVAKQFKFASNKLQHVTEQLGLSGKLSHSGFDMWVKCMAGDERAWALMKKYNMQDVRTTEELYDRLKPWITSHPNVALIDAKKGVSCGKCGSGSIQWRGWQFTQVSSYRRFQCTECGGWGRETRRDAAVTVRSS